MFGFFKKAKPTVTSIESFRKLAQEAVIESVLENGLYSGFLIHTISNSSFFDPHVSNANSIAAFVKTIEKRIEKGGFDDLLDHSLREQLDLPRPRPMHDFGKSTVRRIVVGENRTKLFDWAGPGTVVPQPPSNEMAVHVQLPQNGATSKTNMVKEFKLSFFHIKIETDADDGYYPFKLSATDSRTNQFAFSHGLEVSPFASCLVSVLADGTRVNIGPPVGTMTLESFESWAIAAAIDTIYADQVLTDNEAHAFGVRVVAEHLGKIGFQLLTVQRDILQDPQILAMKDGRTAGIVVRTDAFPRKGTLWDKTEEEIDELLHRTEAQGQDLYFASVGLANSNATNDFERRVLLRNGSFHVSLEGVQKLRDMQPSTFTEKLTPHELACIAEFGAMVATDLSDKIALSEEIESIVHPEFSILGVYLAIKIYLDFTEQHDDILCVSLGILTCPPFMKGEISDNDEEIKNFEDFAGAAICAYEHEAARYLTVNSSPRKKYVEFGKAASRIMLSRMTGYQGFQKSAVSIENMQDAIAFQPEVLEVSFREMRDAGELPSNP